MQLQLKGLGPATQIQMHQNRKVVQTERGSYSQNASRNNSGATGLKNGAAASNLQQQKGQGKNALTNREGRSGKADATSFMMKNAAYVASSSTSKGNHIAISAQHNNWVRTEIKNLK